MSGDYELLCRIYGITGATGTENLLGIFSQNIIEFQSEGRHCCLWCHITQSELKVAPDDRPVQPTSRSLSTLKKNHTEFQTRGKGNSSVAKEYYNVLQEPFFDIPLNQVL